MDLDPTRLVGSVNRELSTREVDGRPAKVVTATRSYDTTPDDLWDALTNPERIPRWFLPVSGDLRPGGHYQLEGNANGKILECEPPSRLGVTWEMHGETSWVTVDLADEEPGRTQLRLEHVAHIPDEMWDQFGPGAAGAGWDQALVGLERHLVTGGKQVDPEEWMAWLQSDDGRAFLQGTSDAWCEASIAAGTDPEAARAAAERTAAFYRGEGPGAADMLDD